MIYRFHTEVAGEFGFPAAPLFYHIAYWVRENTSQKKNYRDGKYWVYESAKGLAEGKHSYLSEHQIRRALDKLVEGGMLIRGNYNRTGYDRTYWYTLTEKAWLMLQKCEKEEANCSPPVQKNDRPIPMEEE